MEKMISATEAVRNFSEILNSIKYRGDRFTVMRGGKPVAAIHPIEPPQKERSLTELQGLLKRIPRLGAARIHARLWAHLAKKGMTIGSHDLVIASTSISLGFSVITSNLRDYGKIEGLKVERVPN